MSQAQDGNTVKVHYTGKLADGTVFDSSADREPLEVKLGTGSVIPGFEKGLVGMKVGEKKTIDVPVSEGYGERSEDLLVEINKTDFPEGTDPQVGQRWSITMKDGNVANVVVASVMEEKVVLDANHPLAGKPLTFDVEMVEIN